MLVSLPQGRVGQPPAASAGGEPITSGRPGDAGAGPSGSAGPDQCQQGADGRSSDHPSLYRHNRGDRGPASPMDLLADLTPSQQQAVTATSPTVCVLASAGAGKTRVLVRRIGYRAVRGAADPGHVVAITFTRKAAGELRERLNQMGLAGAGHGRDLPLPGRQPAEAVVGRPPGAGASFARAQGQAHRRAGGREARASGRSRRRAGQPARMGQGPPSRTSRLRRRGQAKPTGSCRRTPKPSPASTPATRTRSAGAALVDFDDLLARYTSALEGDSRFAAAQRWRWRHVFVDELQDVNPLQYRMLMALLGDNDDLFVVGDPNQAIYGWNGSDPAFLANFPDRWPGAEVVRLDDNHRSSPQVVAAASSVLGRQATAARSSRPDGPLPRLRCYPSEEAEAAGVAAQLLAARARGLRWDQMAVLVRANSQTSAIAQALRRAGVPLQAVGSADSSQLREDEPDVATGQRGRSSCPRSTGPRDCNGQQCGSAA